MQTSREQAGRSSRVGQQILLNLAVNRKQELDPPHPVRRQAAVLSAQRNDTCALCMHDPFTVSPSVTPWEASLGFRTSTLALAKCLSALDDWLYPSTEGYAAVCCAVSCRAVPCGAVRCCAVLCCAVLCCDEPCCAVLCRCYAMPCGADGVLMLMLLLMLMLMLMLMLKLMLCCAVLCWARLG